MLYDQQLSSSSSSLSSLSSSSSSSSLVDAHFWPTAARARITKSTTATSIRSARVRCCEQFSRLRGLSNYTFALARARARTWAVDATTEGSWRFATAAARQFIIMACHPYRKRAAAVAAASSSAHRLLRRGCRRRWRGYCRPRHFSPDQNRSPPRRRRAFRSRRLRSPSPRALSGVAPATRFERCRRRTNPT